MERIELIFPRPDEYVTLNHRLHRQKAHAITKTWKSAVWAHANNLRRTPSFPAEFPEGRVRVTCDFPVKSLKTRRDPHNWAPIVKAIVDGIVTARVLPDDDAEHVTISDPMFHTGNDLVRVSLVDCWWWTA